jgi:transcriptional regulator with XRE-family HTH domain
MQVSLAQRVSQNVRDEMARQGVSQRKLAEHLGLVQSQIWRRLAGEIEFRPSELEKAAELLDVPVEQLLDTTVPA